MVCVCVCMCVYIILKVNPTFEKKHWGKWMPCVFVPIFLSELEIKFCISAVGTLDHSMDLSFVL